MKPSHITTPRTLAECQFAHNADPIERFDRGFDLQDKIAMLGCAASIIALIVLAVMSAL